LRPSPSRTFVFALALLACFLVGPARPARARASVYEVDSVGDQVDKAPGSGGCETAVGSCTLRAAIEEADQSAETLDTIVFDLGFNGQLADTIQLGSNLPQIEGPLTIKGDRFGQCATAASVPGPCVGVEVPSGGTGLRVKSEGVSVEGLAVAGALVGIEVKEGTPGFIAKDDWVGVKLDGGASGGEYGMLVEPGADGAIIGGPASAERVVISGNREAGLAIRGASDTVVQGDYFGVAPDGATPIVNRSDIRIYNFNGSTVENTEIGADLTPEALTTLACDGGCNVISGAESVGVEVLEGLGEPRLVGPMTIRGNYVGLDAAGTGVVPDAQTGIFIGNATALTVGGPDSGDANYIAGGSVGIGADNPGKDLVVQGNRVGVNSLGAAVPPPEQLGIDIDAESASPAHPPTISGNRLQMAGGEGITEIGVGAAIAGNEIFGARIGVHTFEFSGLHPNSIRENLIEGASEDGVLIENDLNEIAANEIFGSGLNGIRIQGPGFGTIHNLVGGDLPGDENTIDGSGGDAIAIFNTEDSDNEVARNRGSGNGGRFIHLIAAEPATEPNGPNEGVKPPPIGAATQSGASGSGAEPGAVIRVFRKATGDLGELQSFLGETTVDGSGNWSLSYPASIPAGTSVAATQTNVESGTSELSIATTSGGSSGGGGSVGVGGGSSEDRTPPQTTILRGPKPKATNRTRTFSFASSEAGSTFECKLDRQPLKKCRSPKTYKKLKPGKHVFQVRAIDKAGNADPTPAKRKFQVLS